MQLEQSYDKVVLTHDEIQQALKKLIETKLNRRVRGDVSVDTRSRSTTGRLEDKCKPDLMCSGYAWLEPGELTRIVEVKHNDRTHSGLDIIS
jgi:hypothetical protein